MESRLIQIGNSKGVRLSKAFLQQTEITDRIWIRVEGGSIVITSAETPRSGWQKAFIDAPAHLTEEDNVWLAADLVDE